MMVVGFHYRDGLIEILLFSKRDLICFSKLAKPTNDDFCPVKELYPTNTIP